ncbi:MAG: GTP-binding protein [Sphaerochaetaceae bacterium]|nr:GTP-binding protein [Sphaerochaetaceae bacterium]
MKRVVMISGGSAVGKTALIKAIIPYLERNGRSCCVCKMDCLHSKDQEIYDRLGIPCVTGLSNDICPDHFLVSNLPELWGWAQDRRAEFLFIESAGLCHRCSPATEQTAAICVLDATASCQAPSQMGPMLTQADSVVITKVDMVSQAEREIIAYRINELTPRANIFFIDGREGYGTELVGDWLLALPAIETYENDKLRHTMPSGVCSYCVGERRVGSDFQLGVVGKIDFSGARG